MNKQSAKIAIEALKYYSKKRWAVDANLFRLKMCDSPTCRIAFKKHEEIKLAISDLELEINAANRR